MNIEFYGLFPVDEIGRKVHIKGDQYFPIASCGTFYRSGIIVGEMELVGVQITQDELGNMMYVLGTESITESMSELHIIDEIYGTHLLDFYQCERSDQESFFRIFPHLAGTHIEIIEGVETEVKNFPGWAGVMQKRG